MFEADFSDNPHLPSPMQLQHKFLIKNKKLVFEPQPSLSDRCGKVSAYNKIALILKDFWEATCGQINVI